MEDPRCRQCPVSYFTVSVTRFSSIYDVEETGTQTTVFTLNFKVTTSDTNGTRVFQPGLLLFCFAGDSSLHQPAVLHDPCDHWMFLRLHAAGVDAAQLHCVRVRTPDGQRYGKQRDAHRPVAPACVSGRVPTETLCLHRFVHRPNGSWTFTSLKTFSFSSGR